MDISLHDAAEFMHNSEITKQNITTSNLTVLENALFNINNVSYKTDQSYDSDILQYPPVDLSLQGTKTVNTVDNTLLDIDLLNGDKYSLKSNDDSFAFANNILNLMRLFGNNADYWRPHNFEGVDLPQQEKRLYTLNGPVPNIGYTDFDSPIYGIKGNWFYLELPYKIVLKQISFYTPTNQIYNFSIFGKTDLVFHNIADFQNDTLSNTIDYHIDNSKLFSKYIFVFQSINLLFNVDLAINSFKLFGNTQTNITSFQNILQTKQNNITTNYGLQLINNSIGFDNVFMNVGFQQYNTIGDFILPLHVFPYKIQNADTYIDGQHIQQSSTRVRLLDISIVDYNTNLAYSYILFVSSSSSVFDLRLVSLFSYFKTSTVQIQIIDGNHKVLFGDFVHLTFQTTGVDDVRCNINVLKQCTLSIVSR